MPDFLTGLTLAVRARYLWLAFFSLVALALAVLLSAQFSGRQPATVALDVGLSVIRLVLPLVSVLMAQALLSHEFERRSYLSSLTYPRPRYQLLLGRISAVLVLVVSLLVVMSLILAVLVSIVSKGYVQSTPVALGAHYLIVVAFIAVDLMLLSVLACFLAVVASSSSFVLIGTLGFMLVARSFAAVIELLARDSALVGNAESYRTSIGFLGYILPDLGSLDVRMVALYGRMEFFPDDWLLSVLSCFSYFVFLLAFATWALQRKKLV